MRRVFFWDKNTEVSDILTSIIKFMPWIKNEEPYFVHEYAKSFLTAYRQAMKDEHKFIIIPFHNVFQDLLLIVGKQ